MAHWLHGLPSTGFSQFTAFAKILAIVVLPVPLEPVNRYEIDYINSVDQGAELVRKTGRKNFALMLDVFHMNIEDAHIGETLIRNREMVKYVHLADTNRLSCGDGHMDWDDVFSALGKMKYDGWCSVECFPVPDAITAAKRTVEFLRERYI